MSDMGAQERQDRFWARNASMATALSALLFVLMGMLGAWAKEALQDAKLAEHERKIEVYDRLHMERAADIATMKADIAWVRRHLEQKDKER